MRLFVPVEVTDVDTCVTRLLEVTPEQAHDFAEGLRFERYDVFHIVAEEKSQEKSPAEAKSGGEDLKPPPRPHPALWPSDGETKTGETKTNGDGAGKVRRVPLASAAALVQLLADTNGVVKLHRVRKQKKAEANATSCGTGGCSIGPCGFAPPCCPILPFLIGMLVFGPCGLFMIAATVVKVMMFGCFLKVFCKVLCCAARALRCGLCRVGSAVASCLADTDNERRRRQQPCRAREDCRGEKKRALIFGALALFIAATAMTGCPLQRARARHANNLHLQQQQHLVATGAGANGNNNQQFVVGSRVLGRYQNGRWCRRYKNNRWYLATVAEARRDGTFLLNWADGDTRDRVKSAADLRLASNGGSATAPSHRHAVGTKRRHHQVAVAGEAAARVNADATDACQCVARKCATGRYSATGWSREMGYNWCFTKGDCTGRGQRTRYDCAGNFWAREDQGARLLGGRAIGTKRRHHHQVARATDQKLESLGASIGALRAEAAAALGQVRTTMAGAHKGYLKWRRGDQAAIARVSAELAELRAQSAHELARLRAGADAALGDLRTEAAAALGQIRMTMAGAHKGYRKWRRSEQADIARVRAELEELRARSAEEVTQLRAEVRATPTAADLDSLVRQAVADKDLDSLVRQVVAENPPQEQGLRPEWDQMREAREQMRAAEEQLRNARERFQRHQRRHQ